MGEVIREISVCKDFIESFNLNKDYYDRDFVDKIQSIIDERKPTITNASRH